MDFLINYLRRHELYETISICQDFFSRTWSDNTVLIFATQKPFSMLLGKEIYDFINMIPAVTLNMKKQYIEESFNKCLIAALK